MLLTITGASMRQIIFILLAMLAFPVSADWYGGNLSQVSVGYDGKTVAIIPAGWSRSNCTCYPAWPNHMCLDNTRETADFEKSLLLSAKARGTKIFFNIDEATCKVIALYELN